MLNNKNNKYIEQRKRNTVWKYLDEIGFKKFLLYCMYTLVIKTNRV